MAEINRGNNILIREDSIAGIRWVTFLRENGDIILKVRKTVWSNKTNTVGFSPELRDSIIASILGIYG